jgi:hypothetical protein
MPIAKATHVLTWYPEGHLDPPSIWELRENRKEDHWEEPDVTLICDWSCAPADTDPAELLSWVRIALNEPVHLGHRQEKRIKTGVFARTVVPFYYVFPGER